MDCPILEESVSISKKEYSRLLQQDEWVSCLDQAGVDNWEGIDYAIELYDQYQQDNGGK